MRGITMKKRIICLTLLCTCMFTTPVLAAENKINEVPQSLERQENVSEAEASILEVSELENYITANTLVNPLVAADDRYEPNDTIETAFPYSNAIKIKCGGSAHDWLGHYNCFYTPNKVSDLNDFDFYKLSLQKGMYYVAVLKNVWTSQTRDIRLYYQKSDGSWWYKYPTNKYEGQSLFHFTAEYNTYYVRISGDNAPGQTEFDDAFNWFAVERDGTIDERLLPYDPKPSHALQ